MEGHLLASLIKSKTKLNSSEIKEVHFPAVALLISGGHTELILIKNWMHYEKIGQTLDDAVGEAFDKVARMMNLPYPGGPEISKLAQIARAKTCGGPTSTNAKVGPPQVEIKLPRPMINTDDFNFSFSGLKTATLYLIKKLREQNKWEELPLAIKQLIAQEFEDAVVEVLLKKSQTALEKFNAQTLILGGGVVANSQIRQTFQSLGGATPKFKVLIPEREFSTDNALMIGIAGYFRFLEQKKEGQPSNMIGFQANGNLKL